MIFRDKKKVILHVRPHLDAFHTGWLNLDFFCNTPEFFLYGGTFTGKTLSLGDADVNVKFFLCTV